MSFYSLDILLVGLGKVGMTYDFGAPKSQTLTHARAIKAWSKSTNTSVNVAGVDLDPETQKPFKDIFESSQWFPSLNQIDPNRSFDLAVFATPISTIAQDTFQACINLDISKVVVEKPAAASLTELATLVSIPNSETKIVVGFPRPLLSSSVYLRNRIHAFGTNQVWKVDIFYGGSVLNILSHFLNLIEFLIEPFKLETFSINDDDYLQAIFKSESGDLLIHTHQYSEFNDEENEIRILGPINIFYTKSGREIKIEDPTKEIDFSSVGISFDQELSQMIGNFGNKYLSWAALGTQSEFTRLTSTALVETIRLAEAVNVR